MARVGSGYCTTDYVARGAEYKARMSERQRTRPNGNSDGAVAVEVEGEAFVDRTCAGCGGPTLDYPSIKDPLCFACCHAQNPYAKKAVRMSVDATGEDSTNPERVADGTAGYNVALPPVEGEIIGKDAYGQTKRKLRPVAHNEISSARKLKERAKVAGLTAQDTQKRALPR